MASGPTASAGTHEIVVTDPSTRTSTSSSLAGARHVAAMLPASATTHQR